MEGQAKRGHGAARAKQRGIATEWSTRVRGHSSPRALRPSRADSQARTCAPVTRARTVEDSGSDASATSPAYLCAARAQLSTRKQPHVRRHVRQTRRPRPRAHRCDNSSGGRSCTQKEVTAQNTMRRQQPDDDGSARSRASIDLYWLPLGAGGHSVRLNGRVYEAVAARLGRRPVSDLYHSALEVRVPEGR
jgi:hypothetical protein